MRVSLSSVDRDPGGLQTLQNRLSTSSHRQSSFFRVLHGLCAHAQIRGVSPAYFMLRDAFAAEARRNSLGESGAMSAKEASSGSEAGEPGAAAKSARKRINLEALGRQVCRFSYPS